MPAILPFFVGTHGGSGTVTSIDATTPNSVLTITGGPITNAGVFVFTLNDAIESIGTIPTSGMIAFDSLGPDFLPRTLAGTANQITVANGTGVAGNPTFSLPASVILGSTSVAGTIALSSGSAGSVTLAAPTGLASNLTFTYPAIAGTSGLYLQATGATTSTWAAISLAGRTITGTANQITVVNGSGAGGNPTISLPSAIIIGQAGVSNGSLTLLSAGGASVGLGTPTTGTSFTRLPPTNGNPGDFLSTDGSGSSSWSSISASQTYQYFTQYVLPVASPLVVNLPGGPFMYELEFIGVCANSDDQLFVEFSNTNGSTWLTGSIQGVNSAYNNGGAFTTSGVASAGSMIIAGFTAFISTNLGFSGTMKLWPDTNLMTFNMDTTYGNVATPSVATKNTNGGIVQASGVNAVRFYFGSGAFKRGTVNFYVKNSY